MKRVTVLAGLLLMLVVLAGCWKETPPPQPASKPAPKAKAKKQEPVGGGPLTAEESAVVIEAAIRETIKKPTGELTKADLEQVEKLSLHNNQISDVSALPELTQLKELQLSVNQIRDVSP